MIIFRLSFYERICDIVPSDFEPLLPEKPKPKYKYALENSSKRLDCSCIDICFY
jgi:hypothetical protein